jgi:hypothetical protein
MSDRGRIPTSTLLESLHELTERLGRVPTASEYTELGRYSLHPLGRRFGGYNAALRAAGLPVNKEYDIDEDRLINDLIRADREAEGSVSKRDYAELGQFAVSTYQDHFGSWKTAKHAAGLEVEGGPVAEMSDGTRQAIEDRLAQRQADALGPVTVHGSDGGGLR